MSITYGLFIYNKVASLDFIGPYETFTVSRYCKQDNRVVTVAESRDPVRCLGGLEVTPDYCINTAPPIDVLVVPGAEDVSNISDEVIEWIKQQNTHGLYTTSVCTGALILQRAGLLAGRKATTHWMLLEALENDPTIEVLADERYVQDGNIVTSQGISAGIDMALWLLGQIHSPEHSRQVAKFLQYEPAPPYADVA